MPQNDPACFREKMRCGRRFRAASKPIWKFQARGWLDTPTPDPSPQGGGRPCRGCRKSALTDDRAVAGSPAVPLPLVGRGRGGGNSIGNCPAGQGRDVRQDSEGRRELSKARAAPHPPFGHLCRGEPRVSPVIRTRERGEGRGAKLTPRCRSTAPQYPDLIFSNSAIILPLSSAGTGDWNSVLSTNFATSA